MKMSEREKIELTSSTILNKNIKWNLNYRSFCFNPTIISSMIRWSNDQWFDWNIELD